MEVRTEENVNVDATADVLNASDADIAAMDFSDFVASTQEEQAVGGGDEEEASEEEAGTEAGEDETVPSGEQGTEAYPEEDGEAVGEEETVDADSEEETESEEEGEEEEEDPDADPEEDGEADSEEADEVNYKEQMEALLAPLKANGKELTIDNIEDARRLMSMGAGFNKKIAAMKPGLKVLKMLENNDLMDETRLSFLIDLDKKNPEAIAKLIQDSGIDPLDVKTEGGTEYKPNTYTATDEELVLDEVIRDIEDTPTYSKTIDVVSNKWDDASKQIAVKNPEVIRILNDQMANGQYDQIMQVVESQRMLGNLTGLSDIQAYRQVGDQLNAAGKFGTPTKPVGKVVKKTVAAKPKEDTKLKDKKRAASPTKGKPAANKKQADFNPLSLSDEEIAEMGMDKFL